jgi:hypothetical protein
MTSALQQVSHFLIALKTTKIFLFLYFEIQSTFKLNKNEDNYVLD